MVSCVPCSIVARSVAEEHTFDHLIAGKHAVGVNSHAVVWIDAFDRTDLEAIVEAELREAGLECEGNAGVAVGVDGLAVEPLEGGSSMSVKACLALRLLSQTNGLV